MVFQIVTVCSLVGVIAILGEPVDPICSVDASNGFLHKCRQYRLRICTYDVNIEDVVVMK
jgi:hypothetical protein